MSASNTSGVNDLIHSSLWFRVNDERRELPYLKAPSWVSTSSFVVTAHREVTPCGTSRRVNLSRFRDAIDRISLFFKLYRQPEQHAP